MRNIKGPEGDGQLTQMHMAWHDAGHDQHPPHVMISHEAFEREIVIQRIVDRLRLCDLATLEAVACILEQGRTKTT